MRAHQEGTGTGGGSTGGGDGSGGGDGGSSGGGTTTGKFAVDDLIQVTEVPLNVRDIASTDGAVVGNLATGTRLCVIDGPVDNSTDVFEWYQIDGGGLQGWVAGGYCSLVSSGGCAGGASSPRFAVGDRIQVSDGPLNLCEQPSTSATIVGSYDTWTQVCVNRGPATADGYEWYDVEGYGLSGWLAGDFCILHTAGGCSRFTTGDKIQVTDGPLNIRSGPGLSYDVIGSYQQWTELCVVDGPIFADSYEWYEVEAYGYRGWVAGEFCGMLAQGGCL